jgi:ADP-ribose diphosphatase
MIKKIGEEILFQSAIFKIKKLSLQIDSGEIKTWEIMEKKDTAMVVPITNDGNVLLIREFYPAINEYQLALPKGRIDSGEDEFSTAQKELQEEIGYKAGKMHKLGVLTMSPGYITQKTHVFLAQELMESKLEGDEYEPIELVPYPFSTFETLIDEGKLQEARVIVALYLARQYITIKHEK